MIQAPHHEIKIVYNPDDRRAAAYVAKAVERARQGGKVTIEVVGLEEVQLDRESYREVERPHQVARPVDRIRIESRLRIALTS